MYRFFEKMQAMVSMFDGYFRHGTCSTFGPISSHSFCVTPVTHCNYHILLYPGAIRSATEAMFLALRAAAFGNVYGLARVVHVYWHGAEEIPKDADKAREWNAKLVQAGKPSGIPGE